ncbi:MAG TPA: serine hydrolase domain-containing protein, partial [Thermoanaerobaculia bacterium]|nr:serine hydrolase domain-containing protein [Thermoanaerobaculia bacterium]
LKGYGTASAARKAPVTPETSFAIGSVSREFTCAALLLAAEEGKLSPTAPVSTFFPGLTEASSVTLLDLGGNVSGYRDYYPLDFVDREMSESTSPDQIVASYGPRPLDFPPGSRYSYSNTGFLILGRAVEKATGEPLPGYLARRIFGPLGMTRTTPGAPPPGPGVAEGMTTWALGPLEPAPPEGPGWLGAAGGIWSTPKDLLAWDLALMEGRVLKESSWKTMTTPRRLPDGRSTGYGCGLGVRDRGAALVLSHGGAVSGFVSRNTLVPATRSAVVLLANADFSAIDALHDALLEKLQPKGDVPAVAGPPAREAALSFLARLREGNVDRAALGDDFAAFLTPGRVAAAAMSLKAAGEPKDVKVAPLRERGGMEVATISFTLGGAAVEALMYRTPDGKIQEFLWYGK